MNKKALILLSGGLDSVVSLAKAKKEYDIKLALFFNYGQKALNKELKAFSEISEFYEIEKKIINLDFLSDISKSSLNNNKEIPRINEKDLENKILTQETANAVWVPNRNALFINIAAAIAETNDFSTIIIGANKEEGATFKDNSSEFIEAINNSLKFSSNKNIKVIAPLIKFDKKQIVEEGISLNIPFESLYSCYDEGNKHCGKCESCQRLKRALALNNRHDIIIKLFNRDINL